MHPVRLYFELNSALPLDEVQTANISQRHALRCCSLSLALHSCVILRNSNSPNSAPQMAVHAYMGLEDMYVQEPRRRQTHRHTATQTNRRAGSQAERQTERERQRDRETDIQTDRQTQQTNPNCP